MNRILETTITWKVAIIVVILFLWFIIFLITPEFHVLKQPNYWKCGRL
jgi:hypothetical protein